jgi:murein DD-endopeptidase MepM/ murein hydrolase activator NlpD
MLVVAAVLVGSGVLPSAAQTDTTTTTVPPSSETTGSTASPPTTGGTTTSAAAQTTSTLSAEEEEKKAEAAGALNAAKADDNQIAAALKSINEEVQGTQSKIDSAQQRLEAARSTMATASELLAESNEEKLRIEDQLRAKAVEGFRSGLLDPGVFFSDESMSETLRQTQLLQQANRSTADLLEDLRALKEDREVAQAEAAQAALDAEQLEAELTAELAVLEEQQAVQLDLKSEAESRIGRWESALTAYAAEDEEIQQLIADSAATPVSQIREPSSLGFQWPVDGPVTSGYGYRIHPVYGTRKLHSGIDISAANGTPISSSGAGTVIFAGVQGGYGNTVIVDHGLGVTSLYAHMSRIGVSNGTAVGRGDILGNVGSTGTATGPHLHFEIRLSGATTDPRPYLP